MISLEIRINGSLIAVINAINRTYTVDEIHPSRGPKCRYEWTSAAFPVSLSQCAETYTGVLEHFRGDGAVKLVEAICNAHAKAAKKRNKDCATTGKAPPV